MAVFNQEALNDRAENLEAKGLNGLKLVLVSLQPEADPSEARLEVHFHNALELDHIVSDPQPALLTFPITGGHRLVAGPESGQVCVTAITRPSPARPILVLIVKPIGDYSTYTLHLNHEKIDPLFSEINFKFRPGCFNVNCQPEWQPASPPKNVPVIDYLAKDYDSFRHTLIAWMMRRLPGWEPTSEADLDQVLLEVFSAAADELSDFQDRVMNEAYLSRARKRVSLARHARLMDYHIHQGNQASAWVALKTSNDDFFDLPPDFQVQTIGDNSTSEPTPAVFITRGDNYRIFALLNEISLYTWSGAIVTLAAGCTEADLAAGSEHDATAIQDALRSGQESLLLIQEHKNPATGQEAGRDPKKRQILRLLPGDQGATALRDPFTGDWYVHVCWQEEDKLNSNYCFEVECSDGPVGGVTLFHGNLAQVYHGRQTKTTFEELGDAPPDESKHDIIRTESWGAICELPEGPLAYRETPIGGETPPQSTLQVDVKLPGGGQETWQEVISLIHSQEFDPHFIVETDEMGKSVIRFGNGVNGRKLPEGATVFCAYQVGFGPDGNLGADKLAINSCLEISECWNPFDVTNGRAPEPVATIIRRAPEAYRARQLRAVTLSDYKKRAEELDLVSQAEAHYAWTGSWRDVQIVVDPKGQFDLPSERRAEINRYLDAVRLIGEDVEILLPRFVPLDIRVRLCVVAEQWPQDLRAYLEQEFSNGYTPDGRKAFFHPDLWTFGQPLHASQIIGRAQSVPGVDHVIEVMLERWKEPPAGPRDLVEMRPDEIISVRNDPDHMEKGFISFELLGGRQ